ncbi:MAG TPA: hypothetical protein VFW04_08420 [Gemmatimonadaceae bacterium]|nr:hypothetical protein [Gemmatimonadaceae bacterium]
MAGVFGVTPMQPYPSWAQGLEQGTGAIANAIYQRRMLDLERQKFGLQQAEAGYQPAHQEQVYTPGRLAQPSMVSVGNVPSPTPGTSTMGASSNGTVMGSPDAMARTTGSYKTTTVPGYYDITKSLPYAQAELNGRLMAAIYGGQIRNQGLEQRYGGVDPNGNYQPGSEYYLRTGVVNARNQGQLADINARGDQTRQTDQFLYGGQGPVDPATGQPLGARTMSTLATQAPVLDERRQAAAAALATRQAAQSDLAAHRRATESAAAVRAAQQAVDADTRSMPKPPAFGFLNPSDSVAFYNRRAAAQARLTTDQSRLDSLNNAPTGLVTTPGARPFSSGSSVAPHVPRSGTEASNLTPTLRPMGSVAPSTTLGNRQVPNQSTSTRPTATYLPRSPGDPTVSQGAGGASERALYDAAVRRIAQNVSDPAEQARQFQQAAAIYQQRVARQKAPR